MKEWLSLTFSIIALACGGAAFVMMLIVYAATREEEEKAPLLAYFDILTNEIKGICKSERVESYVSRNATYGVVTECMKAIEAAGLSFEEAQQIPEELKAAISFQSAQAFHSEPFTAFAVTIHPDEKGRLKVYPEAYRRFTTCKNRKVKIRP